MIDTFQMYCRPDLDLISEIRTKFKPHKCRGRYIWTLKPVEGLSMKCITSTHFNLLQIVVTPAVILNKQYIVDEDYDSVVDFINEKLTFYFGRLCFSDFKLSRIDYKLDIKTPYKDIYLGILKKLRFQYRRRVRENYPTSVYYRGNSYVFNLYDKAAKEAPEIHREKYKDVLRLEIQVKSGYLRKLKRDKDYALESSLQNYFNNFMRVDLFNKMLTPTLYKGDYYTTRKSRYVLENYGYTTNMINKLLQFQKLVIEYDITGAIRKSGKSGNTVRSYLVKLQDAGVNPIPLPYDCKVNHLVNMLSYLNTP